jgi:hypothetical protein
MRLHVNLIPALAYALVMLFSNMAGMSGTAEQSSKKQQAVFLPAACPEMNKSEAYVFVASNGQVVLSNGTGKGRLEWDIPYKSETSFVLL